MLCNTVSMEVFDPDGELKNGRRSIEDIYKPACEEIVRRKAAAELIGDPKPPPETEGIAPDGSVALVSIGSDVLAPRPVDKLFPALRIYGIFEEREDAKEHAEIVRALDDTCSLVVVQCHEWMMIPQTVESRDDVEENVRRRDAKLARRARQRQEDDDKFEQCRRDNVARGEVRSAQAEWDEEQEETEAAVREVYKRPKRLRAGGEVRGQAAAVVIVVPDHEDGECLFKVVKSFESVAEANEWSETEGRSLFPTEDLLVTPTCEWCYPNSTRVKSEKTHYREREQQLIMNAAEENPKKVKRYKEWLKEQAKQEKERVQTLGSVAEEEGKEKAKKEVGNEDT